MLEFRINYQIGGKPRYSIIDEAEPAMQIPSEVRDPMMFLYFKDRRDKELKIAGTAFLTSMPSEGEVYWYYYIVTAKHVIAGIKQYTDDGKVLLRLNKRDGTSDFIETNITDWYEHPTESDSVDVAVLPGLPPLDVFDVKAVPLMDAALTDDAITTEGIGIGEDVFITGAFVNHTGRQRILPIIRTGSIALLPEEKVNVKDFGDIDAYLVESRSIGGLSGSPVFVYLSPTRIGGDGNFRIGTSQRFYLLGLMHGHWDLPASELDATLDISGRKEAVNMGIAIVVPVNKILEVINQPEFMAARKKDRKKREKAKLPTPDFAITEPTKTEFEEALKKSARKINPSQSDRQEPPDASRK